MEYADLKAIRSTAPLNGKSVPILRPPELIRNLFVSARGDGDWRILADLDATEQLGRWCSLAATSPECVVWIPKSGDRPNWDQPGFETCDLILGHHSLQLRPASWKPARAYAKKGGKPQTLSVALPTENLDIPKTYRQMHRPPGEDVADFALHSNTVFMAGSAPIFRLLAYLCKFQRKATVTGDHTHLFGYARHEPRDGAAADLTLMYVAPEEWN